MGEKWGPWEVIPAHDGRDPEKSWQCWRYRSYDEFPNDWEECLGGFMPKEDWGEVVTRLNALETDKAALLEALEEWSTARAALSGTPASMGVSVRFTYAEEALSDLLSRIRSEGAEVKAGE